MSATDKAAHTPGPWGVRVSGEVGTDQMMVACIYPLRSEAPEENAANACLIAAAPELLAIAERLKAAGGVWPDLAPALDAAIAKARGEA